MRSPAKHAPRPRGITLVELLVVVTIMMLLALVAIPTMRPMMESRQLREATRAVNAYIHGAQILAIETGRPAGIMLVRDPLVPQAGTSIQQVVVPPVYAGNVVGAAVAIQEWTRASTGSGFYWPDRSVVLKVRVRQGDLSPGLVRRGDQIRFNAQGPWYTIAPAQDATAAAISSSYTDFPLDANGFVDFAPPGVTVRAISGYSWINSHVLTVLLPPQVLPDSPWEDTDPLGGSGPGSFNDNPPTDWSWPVLFQIRRAPMKAAAAPLQLPQTVVMDLSCSGTDAEPDLFGRDALPVLVLFSPTGAIDQVFANGRAQLPIYPLYLMMGLRERAPPQVAEDGLANWQVLQNLWLAINPKTGTINAAQVYADASDAAHLDATTGVLRPDTILSSRGYARELQTSMGGR